jgi:hypothetical protein
MLINPKIRVESDAPYLAICFEGVGLRFKRSRSMDDAVPGVAPGPASLSCVSGRALAVLSVFGDFVVEIQNGISRDFKLEQYKE